MLVSEAIEVVKVAVRTIEDKVPFNSRLFDNAEELLDNFMMSDPDDEILGLLTVGEVYENDCD